jgi:hypothetical protein
VAEQGSSAEVEHFTLVQPGLGCQGRDVKRLSLNLVVANSPSPLAISNTSPSPRNLWDSLDSFWLNSPDGLV